MCARTCAIACLLSFCLRSACDNCSSNVSEDGPCKKKEHLGRLPKVLVASLVLPDGLGDVVFGECAAVELMQAPSAVTWLRVYPNMEVKEKGEALLAEAASVASANSRVYQSYDDFAQELASGRIERLWKEAQEIFLAPWFFGIGRDQSLLGLAQRVGRTFWAMSEYGRGMGHIDAYSNGLGFQIPTGWPQDSSVGPQGGVFKTILRAPRDGRNWSRHFAEVVGIHETDTKSSEIKHVAPSSPRLWWAYGRKDSSTIHEFKLLRSLKKKRRQNATGYKKWPEVAKIIPIAEDGSLASGVTKTTGELLQEQVNGLLDDPNHVANVHVSAPSETVSHVAGQLSQLIAHILTQNVSQSREVAAEIIVAPNAGIAAWAGASVIRITSLELLSPSGVKKQVTPARPIFLVAEAVPRHEMRSFLEQCEQAVVATGDQSVAEAILLGKVPMAKPDAKVSQWEQALSCMAKGTVETTPDLGEVLRRVLSSADEREKLESASRMQSAKVEVRLLAEVGAKRSDTQELLARAGMFG